MKFLPIVWRNLLRNRRRTILTVLSISLTIFMFAALLSLPAAVSQLLRDRSSSLRLVVADKSSFFYLLPRSYANTIRNLPHVEAVTGDLETLARYRDPGDQIPLIGLDPTELETIFPDWSIAPEAASQLQEIRQSGVVSASLARRYKWKIGDRVTLHPEMMTFDPVDFTIVGMIGSGAPMGLVIVPIERLQHGAYEDGVLTYIVRLDHAENAPLVIREIDERFADSGFETQTQTELGVMQTQMGQMRILFSGVEAIALIIVLVVAIVAANTGAMAARERRAELAVMRSLGFTRSRLIGLMMAEGLLIGLVAGALGCAAAYSLLLLNPGLSGPLGMVLQFVHLLPSVMIGSLALAAAIGLLGFAIPARNATRGAIAQKLRAIA
ncbi:MAG: ABC transporter permease [Candidatus Binataceae bacterium]